MSKDLNVGKVTAFDTSGQLDVIYRGDRIDVSVTPSDPRALSCYQSNIQPKLDGLRGLQDAGRTADERSHVGSRGSAPDRSHPIKV